MNISAKLLYKIREGDITEIILSENKNENAEFDIQYKLLTHYDKQVLSFKSTLLKDMTVEMEILIFLELPHEEKFLPSKDFFPRFSFKSNTPFYQVEKSTQQNIVLKSDRPHAFTKTRSKHTVEYRFIIDAPYLHPAWDLTKGKASIAAPIISKGTSYFFELDIYTFCKKALFLPLQTFMYPNAKRSCFILTDHCDFDKTEKLQSFLYGENNNGWLGRGLKITKGVFALGFGENDVKKSDALNDPAYFRLVKLLHEDGSEIVPHALKSRGQLSADAFSNAMEYMHENWKPKTWIDHGSYLQYCYSQGGKFNPDYRLIDSLKKFKYNNLWSFHDIGVDAAETLNIYTNKRKLPFHSIGLIFKNLFTGKFFIAMHFFRSIFHRNYSKNIFIDFMIYAMAGTKYIIMPSKKSETLLQKIKVYFKNLENFKSTYVPQQLPYKEKDILQFCAPIYTEERRPLAQMIDGDLLMFMTFETTHLNDIYNRKKLNQLVAEYGLHIGHTYILNTLPYLNHIFKIKNEKYFLKKNWVQFLDILSGYVANNNTWNPNMGEYIHYTTSLLKVKIVYTTSDHIIITNNNTETVYGYTFVLPVLMKGELYMNGKKTVEAYKDKNYAFYCMDLLAGEEVGIHIS
ncbi:MAG: hypothetical protein WAU24_13040 [Chitinophagaceae bacterium]